jgi:hypothetical protein
MSTAEKVLGKKAKKKLFAMCWLNGTRQSIG